MYTLLHFIYFFICGPKNPGLRPSPSG